MTPERHHHYRAALAIIDDVGPAKLHGPERELLAQCAEDLLLSDDALAVRACRHEALALLGHLVESGRWLAPTAERLAAHIEACGPAPVLAA